MSGISAGAANEEDDKTGLVADAEGCSFSLVVTVAAATRAYAAALVSASSDWRREEPFEGMLTGEEAETRPGEPKTAALAALAALVALRGGTEDGLSLVAAQSLLLVLVLLHETEPRRAGMLMVTIDDDDVDGDVMEAGRTAAAVAGIIAAKAGAPPAGTEEDGAEAAAGAPPVTPIAAK